MGAPGDFCELLFAGRQSFAGAAESPWTRPDYLRLICMGGYPEVVSIDNPINAARLVRGYLSTVVLRDVAKDLQLNHVTVRNYLRYLDTVFLTGRVPPWSANLNAKLVKTPKVFPTDSGLAAHLLQVEVDALAAPGHPATGILVETFVYAELTRLLAVSDLGATQPSGPPLIPSAI